MMSLWSFQMLRGPEIARLATDMTMGRRIAEAMGNTSAIYISPWELVAVKVLAPVAEAPITALIAECSDSTGRNSASILPSATISDKCSATWVFGVMG